MTNITPDVSSLLIAKHSCAPIQGHAHALDRLDTFLQEAYRINTHINSLIRYLRQIRQPYLSTVVQPPSRVRANDKSATSSISTTYLTDPQRAEIDTETSRLLHDLSSNISSLTAAENLRSSTESALLERRYGKAGGNDNALWRWAGGGGNSDMDDLSQGKGPEQLEAEGEANGKKAARESILWYLGTRLQQALEIQRGMVEVRAAREREREKSVLWKTGASSQFGGGQMPRRPQGGNDSVGGMVNGSRDYQTDRGATIAALAEDRGVLNNDIRDDEIPPNMRQLFESENSTLLQHYESSLSKVQAAEKSLLEIASLQQTLVSHLSTQGEMVEHLVQDAAGTGKNVESGNRELKRAGERWGRGLAQGVFWGTVSLCGFCIAWDLIF